ncbi:globin domain-containing protein [Larkinella soli]|uniref:globin domain-containing protein n=1 Tax=Larkinella soli TaxID=1770527 RepID=UPI000FFB98D5|nr:globin domain-containing protein [Larkinella soli]
MTDQHIQTVRKSWRLLREVDPHLLGEVFYKRLFLKYPATRSLFKGSMTEQYEKFVVMLSFIVARIDRFDLIRAEVADLARRHEGYGVKPAHYALVGDALLWTLEQGLGHDWNEDVRRAWQACYQTLTEAMLEKV